MRFHIITLFPESFDSYLNESILKRAIKDKKISVDFYNPRDFVETNKKFGEPGYFAETRIDDKPYAGGPGMVMAAEPVLKAVEAAIIRSMKHEVGSKKGDRSKKFEAGIMIVWLTPDGTQFDTTYAKKISKKFIDVIIICGRYEGIDARVKTIAKKIAKGSGKLVEISIGPFVLTGGELPALVMMDCIARQVPGVLGNFDSREEERIASSDVYTRPEVLEWKGKKYRVPKVLLSGDHKKIEEWRKGH